MNTAEFDKTIRRLMKEAATKREATSHMPEQRYWQGQIDAFSEALYEMRKLIQEQE